MGVFQISNLLCLFHAILFYFIFIQLEGCFEFSNFNPSTVPFQIFEHSKNFDRSHAIRAHHFSNSAAFLKFIHV